MLTREDVTLLAERAMLGALLVDPAPFRELDAWVRGTDFSEPWHRQVWISMREAHVAAAPTDTVSLGMRMVQRYGPRIADLPRLHLLLHDAPQDPDPRPHARIVVDAGVRRDVDGQGVLLRATALEASMSHEGRPLRSALRIAGAAVLIACERWADANGEVTDHLTAQIPARLRAGADDLELRRAADKFVADYPGIDLTEVGRDEQRLVANLATHPTAISPTVAWMRPDQLTNRPWATVYSALAELAAGGQTIDPTMVAMATVRIARDTGVAPSLPALMNSVDYERTSVPGHLRQIVAGDHLRLAAAQGTEALHQGATSPDVPIVDLLQTATALLHRMQHLSTALPDQIDVGPRGRRGAWQIDPPAAGPISEGPAAG